VYVYDQSDAKINLSDKRKRIDRKNKNKKEKKGIKKEGNF